MTCRFALRFIYVITASPAAYSHSGSPTSLCARWRLPLVPLPFCLQFFAAAFIAALRYCARAFHRCGRAVQRARAARAYRLLCRAVYCALVNVPSSRVCARVAHTWCAMATQPLSPSLLGRCVLVPVRTASPDGWKTFCRYAVRVPACHPSLLFLLYFVVPHCCSYRFPCHRVSCLCCVTHRSPHCSI